MSWTDDEKRAALELLSRIASGIETLIADTRAALHPETLASMLHSAQEMIDDGRVERHLEPEDGLDDSDEDEDPTPKEH